MNERYSNTSNTTDIQDKYADLATTIISDIVDFIKNIHWIIFALLVIIGNFHILLLVLTYNAVIFIKDKLHAPSTARTASVNKNDNHSICESLPGNLTASYSADRIPEVEISNDQDEVPF